MKTAIQKIIDSVTEMKKCNVELTNEEILKMLDNALSDEKGQILGSFNEGMKYGSSPIQTFDYPTSSYYMFTYTEE